MGVYNVQSHLLNMLAYQLIYLINKNTCSIIWSMKIIFIIKNTVVMAAHYIINKSLVLHRH
jgi:hypothetical protein